MRDNHGITLAIHRCIDGRIASRGACVVLASGSSHKLAEFRRVFEGSRVRLLSPVELGCQCDVDESGETFAANARLKAVAYARACRWWSLGDDSGLEIDALNGAPGIRSSRFAGPAATDDDRNTRVLEILTDVAQDDRTARYRCAVAVADPQGVIAFEMEATVEGVIGHAPSGDGGFGYDPLFIVGPGNTTMAELPGVAKDVISHRGQGGRAARAFLERVLLRAGA
ncbi:MAG: non-canonical purine NTP pyrophosphatase [Chloroflexi bacterium]|nr:non-canonical purine NTP pyrophosphatase [Chloroflexota bacterium]